MLTTSAPSLMNYLRSYAARALVVSFMGRRTVSATRLPDKQNNNKTAMVEKQDIFSGGDINCLLKVQI